MEAVNLPLAASLAAETAGVRFDGIGIVSAGETESEVVMVEELGFGEDGLALGNPGASLVRLACHSGTTFLCCCTAKERSGEVKAAAKRSAFQP